MTPRYAPHELLPPTERRHHPRTATLPPKPVRTPPPHMRHKSPSGHPGTGPPTEIITTVGRPPIPPDGSAADAAVARGLPHPGRPVRTEGHRHSSSRWVARPSGRRDVSRRGVGASGRRAVTASGARRAAPGVRPRAPLPHRPSTLHAAVFATLDVSDARAIRQQDVTRRFDGRHPPFRRATGDGRRAIGLSGYRARDYGRRHGDGPPGPLPGSPRSAPASEWGWLPNRVWGGSGIEVWGPGSGPGSKGGAPGGGLGQGGGGE